MKMSFNPAQPLAISYLRFSTPEQERGDSFRRQSQLAEQYALRHGLKLTDEYRFEDRGVSAFRGRNSAQGTLGSIVALVSEGMIPAGTHLLVEGLDRLSRQDPFDASWELQTIIRAGLVVVTLADEAVYSRETMTGTDGIMRMFASLMIMGRAHEESRTKGRRVAAAWEGKRARAASQGERLTKIAPAWLKAADSGWDVDREKAAIVRRVYEMYRSGVGKHGIARALNSEGLPPLGRGGLWHPSAVQKLVENAAVIGTFTPHRLEVEGSKKRREPLEPIPGYFPAIIPQDLWDDVQARRRAVKPRGNSAKHPVQNVLAGIAKCCRCGGASIRVQKGPRSTPKLVCSAAKNGKGCEYVSTDYAAVEKAIRENGLAAVATAPLGGQTLELEQQLIGLLESIELRESQLSNIVREEAQHGSSPKLRETRLELEADLVELRPLKKELEARVVEASPAAVKTRMAALEAVLARGFSDEAEPASAREINEALVRTCEAAVIDDRNGSIQLIWRHGGESRIVYGWPTFSQPPAITSGR